MRINKEKAKPAYGLGGFIDVETTGLLNRDEIIEFSIGLFQFNWEYGEINKIIEIYTGRREPAVPIKKGAARVHGLTMTDVKGKKLNKTKIRTLIKQADILLAHNVSFDKRFVISFFPCARNKSWLCSMNGIKWNQKGFSSRGLQSLLKLHKINPGRAHRAEADVKASIKLLNYRKNNGETYFKELIARETGRENFKIR